MPKLVRTKRQRPPGESAGGWPGIRDLVSPNQRGDDVLDGGRDHLRGLSPIEEPELALVAVVADQRCRLFEKDIDPVIGDIAAVVLAVAGAQPVQWRPPAGLEVD